MRGTAIFTACLVMVWLAFQTAMAVAHVGPDGAQGLAHVHSGTAHAQGDGAHAHDAGEWADSGCGSVGHVSGHGQSGDDGAPSTGCCSVACVAFVTITLVMPERALPEGSYVEHLAVEPRTIEAGLATPPPNSHL